MDSVHLLWHSHSLPQGEGSSKLIGVYSSLGEARAAQARLADKPGFIDSPAGFLIEKMTIGKDHWEEGYITYPATEDSDPGRAVCSLFPDP